LQGENSVTMGEQKIAKTKHDIGAVMRRFVLMPLQQSSGKGVFPGVDFFPGAEANV